jgi:recombination protein RecR
MSFSPLIEKLITSLRCLPSVGPKTAQRMAFELLQKKRKEGLELAKVVHEAMNLIANCSECRNFSETEVCSLCSNNQRDHTKMCIVETPSDVVAIEQTASYKGHYFVLMGHLSPLDGIGPEHIGIDLLLSMLIKRSVTEVIIATSCTPEGEATAFYIIEQVKNLGISCSRIAHGVPIGGELEYLDSNTISRALTARTQVDQETH